MKRVDVGPEADRAGVRYVDSSPVRAVERDEVVEGWRMKRRRVAAKCEGEWTPLDPRCGYGYEYGCGCGCECECECGKSRVDEGAGVTEGVDCESLLGGVQSLVGRERNCVGDGQRAAQRGVVG